MSTLKIAEEPPLNPIEAVTARIARLLLLVICAGPIAVFPIGLAYKGYQHFFGAETPSAVIQTTPR
jgi:hypothetical protein